MAGPHDLRTTEKPWAEKCPVFSADEMYEKRRGFSIPQPWWHRDTWFVRHQFTPRLKAVGGRFCVVKCTVCGRREFTWIEE